MEKKTLGSFIAVLRKSRGMTQKELAEKLGVSDKTISHWERDESAPDINMIPVIAEIFDVTCDELLKGEKAENKEKLSFESEKEDFERFLRREWVKEGLKAGLAELIFLCCLTLSLLFTYKLEWISFFIALTGYLIATFIFIVIRMQMKNAPYNEKLTEKQKNVCEIKYKFACPLFIVLNSFLLLFSLCIVLEKVFYPLPDLEMSLFLFRMGIMASGLCFFIFVFNHYYQSLKPTEKTAIIFRYCSRAITSLIILAFAGLVLQTYTPYIFKNYIEREPQEFETMEELKDFMETEKEPLPFAEGVKDTLNVMTEFEERDSVTYCKFYSYETEELLISFRWLNLEVEKISFYLENGVYIAEVSYPVSPIINYKEIVNNFAPYYYAIAVALPVLICIFKIKRAQKLTEA